MKPRLRVAISLTAAMAIGAAASLVVQHVRAAGAPESGSLVYRGQLALPDGSMVNGPKNIGLGLFDAATAGTRVCDAPSTAITVTAGRFDLSLPDACVTAIKANPNLWVEVQVDGGPVGRSKLAAVPYAIEAGRAVSALTASSATVAQSAASAEVAAKLAAGPISGGLQVFNVPGTAITTPCVATSGVGYVDCTCPAGTYVVSGGGDAGQATGKIVRESRPLAANAWRVTCSTETGDVTCATYSLVCSRVAP